MYTTTTTNNNNSNDESEYLLSPIAKVRQTSERVQQFGRGILINRIAVIIVLVVLCIPYVVYTQNQMNALSVQMEDMSSRIESLEGTSQQHSMVIQRFNSSITNHDIIAQLDALQYNVTTTTHLLHTELKHTKEEIQEELTLTIQALNKTVDAAEMEISEQVLHVKHDVEQYVITTQDQFSMENSFMVYQLAGTFTVLSCLISMWHMTGHLRKLHQPTIQRKILAILWMSPIYAITSWFSLVFHSAEGYLAIVKDFYEAYVIYQFLSFCIAVLGKGDRNVVVDLLAQHADHLTPPFRLLSCCEVMTCGRCCIAPNYESPRHLADAILLQCQVFAVQFVFFRPVTTTAIVILQKMNYYGPIMSDDSDSNNDAMNHLYSPQFYIAIVQNISIFVAFAGLLKFYHAVDQELAWCRPFAKFLCIKGVVFMTFWQGLILSVLAQTTDIIGGGNGSGINGTSNDTNAANEWAKSAQNFLICLEMLLFSIAHFYCFPTEEWEDGYRVKHSAQDGSTINQFGDSIALGDFLADLKLILKTGKKTKKGLLVSSSSTTTKQHHNNNPTIPEGDDETCSDDNQTISDIVSTTASSCCVSIDGNSGDVDIDDDIDNHDSTAVIGDRVPSKTNDDDEDDNSNRMIARALQDSLGELADDPEIAEATKRLLDSNILRQSFFDYESNSRSTMGNTRGGNNINNNNHRSSADTMNGNVSTGNDSVTDSSSTPARRRQEDIDSEIDALISDFTTTASQPLQPPIAVPTEQTTLLSSSSTTTTTTPTTIATTSLRPSIFTTIASIAENEDPDR